MGRYDRTTDERLAEHSRRAPSGCLEWIGSLNGSGYGTINVGGENRLAHRIAWAQIHGDPGKVCILHCCDNRRCIDVRHLFQGTRSENSLDMVLKGRQRGPVGERNSSAKLTSREVMQIRRMYKQGRISQASLASTFGVHQTTVSLIVQRKNWV